jgi:hypothetical protein
VERQLGWSLTRQQRDRRWELREEARQFHCRVEGEKGRGKWGSWPGGAEEGGGFGRRACGVGPPAGSGAPPAEAGARLGTVA